MKKTSFKNATETLFGGCWRSNARAGKKNTTGAIRGRSRGVSWARETVKTTVPEEEEGGDRDIYTKVFKRKKGMKGFVVLVSVRNGEVWNFYPKPAEKL